MKKLILLVACIITTLSFSNEIKLQTSINIRANNPNLTTYQVKYFGTHFGVYEILQNQNTGKIEEISYKGNIFVQSTREWIYVQYKKVSPKVKDYFIIGKDRSFVCPPYNAPEIGGNWGLANFMLIGGYYFPILGNYCK